MTIRSLLLCISLSLVRGTDAFASSYAQKAACRTVLQASSDHDDNETKNTIQSTLLAAFTGLVVSTSAAWAVSGGGLDFAGLDISGQDFSSANYKGKDFTQVLAKQTTFTRSNLQGCRFYKAYLVQANFAGADLRGASLEDTSLDDAIFTDTVAAGAYFSSSILDVKDLSNADFSEAQFPLKTLPQLCDRADLKGTNPVTGVDTKESLMCP